MKTLIAYFSHTGENYFGGSIKNISKGNTEVVAEFAQKASGGDLFQIQTVKDYPVNYKECTEVAAAEGRAGERPALKGSQHSRLRHSHPGLSLLVGNHAPGSLYFSGERGFFGQKNPAILHPRRERRL